VGTIKKTYNSRRQSFGRWIIHLFSILFAPPVAPAVFCLTVSLLPFQGLPVTVLGFLVNPASS